MQARNGWNAELNVVREGWRRHWCFGLGGRAVRRLARGRFEVGVRRVIGGGGRALLGWIVGWGFGRARLGWVFPRRVGARIDRALSWAFGGQRLLA